MSESPAALRPHRDLSVDHDAALALDGLDDHGGHPVGTRLR